MMRNKFKNIKLIILTSSVLLAISVILNNIYPKLYGDVNINLNRNSFRYEKVPYFNPRIKKRDENYINNVSKILNEILEEKKKENEDISEKTSNKEITIKLLLKNSVFGLQGTDIEKDFFMELLNEWAKKEFQEREENIKFEISIDDTTDIIKEKINSLLYLKSSEYDIVMLDIVWTNQYKDHLLNLQLYIDSDTVDLYRPTIISSCQIDNRLIALPIFTDYGIMLYRKDLLNKYERNVPETWDELEETSLYIMKKEQEAGNTNLCGFIGQYYAGEGATCNYMEWIYSYRESFNSECGYFKNNDAIDSLNKMVSFVDKKIITDESIHFDEYSSLNYWLDGKTIFMRNWPSSIQSTSIAFENSKMEFGVTILPGRIKGISASALGGWNLAVSKYSSYPEISAKAVEYLTSEKLQKLRATLFNLLPTMEHLYEDEEVCKVIDCVLFKNVQGVLRPSDHSNYNQYSEAIYDNYRKALIKEIDASHAIQIIVSIAESKLTSVLETLIHIETYLSLGIVSVILVLIIFCGIYYTLIEK